MIDKTINELKIFLSQTTKKNVFHVHEPDIQNSDHKALRQCIKNNQVSTSGSFEKKLEKKLKRITKSKYIILTNSGTSALHISCLLSGVKNNDEVLIPAFTFVASANAVKYCNGTPHFVEIENKNFTIDTIKLEKYLKNILIKKKNYFINKKTKNIVKAIMPVHPFGHPCNMKSIKKIAKKYKLKIIEDAADVLGSCFYNKHVGTFGDFGVLSFNGNKVVTTGAGGAIITKKKSSLNIIRKPPDFNSSIETSFVLPSINHITFILCNL